MTLARPALLAAVLLAAGCKPSRRPAPAEPPPLPQAPQPVAPPDGEPPRDGEPPTKTPDPRPAGAPPLVPSLSPIADASDPLQPQAWAGDAFVAIVQGPTGLRLVLWNDLAKPPLLLAQVTGTVTRIVASPRHDQLALLVFRQTDHPAPSPDDPADLLIVPTDRRGARPLFTAGDDFTVRTTSQVVWSPDGAALAVDGDGPGQRPRPTQTRVYEVRTGKLLASTPGDTPGPTPKRWEGATLFLRKRAESGGQILRWRPGKDAPTPAGPDAPTLRAPDGKHTVAFGAASIEIAGRDGSRRFDATSEGERAAVRALREHPDLAVWLGGRALVLPSGAPMALELATGKLRSIFPEGDIALMSASADGARVVARDRDQRLLWGRVTR